MTTDQAKALLACYRGPADDADPMFAEALALARQDAELGRWLVQQQAFDAALRGTLPSVPTPLGLKARILAGHRKPPAVAWWHVPAWLSGTLVFLAVILVMAWPQRPDFAAFREEMVRFVSVDYQLDTHAATLSEAMAAFAQAGWPAGFHVPPALRQLAVEGGCRLTWQKQKVTLLCLETERDGDVWLFVADRHAFALPPAAGATIAGRPTTWWQDAAYAYLLVAERTLPQ